MESSSSGGGGDESCPTATVVETAAEGLSASDVFHVLKEIIGFALYSHNQIPAILQHLENEFDNLKEEYKLLEETIFAPTEPKAYSQRKHNFRKREVKQGIKKLEKLMNSISNLLSSLQQALYADCRIHEFTLVLGASPARPYQVYEISIPHERVDSVDMVDTATSKAAEAISKKAIRALLSSSVGYSLYEGPSKLFLLIRGSCTSKIPLDFLPKRDFRYSSKVVPIKLHIKCKGSGHPSVDFNREDVIQFQCRHAVKGVPLKSEW